MNSSRNVSLEHQRYLGILTESLKGGIPDLLAVYRFGSWGTAAERADSDIDLAVLAQRPLAATRRWELAQQLAAIAGKNVDLVDLTTASAVLRAQVVAGGDRLFCADEARCSEFEDFVFSDYARLNEERCGILSDIRERGSVYGR